MSRGRSPTVLCAPPPPTQTIRERCCSSTSLCYMEIYTGPRDRRFKLTSKIVNGVVESPDQFKDLQVFFYVLFNQIQSFLCRRRFTFYQNNTIKGAVIKSEVPEFNTTELSVQCTRTRLAVYLERNILNVSLHFTQQFRSISSSSPKRICAPSP